MLSVHDQVPLLPIEFPEIFFASTECINSRGVNLEEIGRLI